MPPRTTTTPTSWSGQRRSFPTATAQRIIRRDKVCQGCSSAGPLQADHIVNHAEALVRGWTQDEIDHEDNGQALCQDCHAEKTRGERARGLARAAGRRAPARTQRPHPGLLA